MSRRLTIEIADDVYDHLVSRTCKPENVCGFAEHIVMAAKESALRSDKAKQSHEAAVLKQLHDAANAPAGDGGAQ